MPGNTYRESQDHVPMTNRRILVIDDSIGIHDDFRKVLTSEATSDQRTARASENLFGSSSSDDRWATYEIDSAYQGEEALEIVRGSLLSGRPFALAFVDICMPPGWNGIETVKRIWQIDPEILVVFCSAYSEYSWGEMVDHLGPSDRFLILKKPFDTIEVRQFALALTKRWNIARTDVLTGVMNRRALHDYADYVWKTVVKHGIPLSCVMMDLDFFKRVNDRNGHAAGDEALRAIARLLKRNSRHRDYICRYGGEELCILLPEANESHAAEWAERIREKVSQHRIPFGERELSITASFGVAEYLEDVADLDQLIDRADQALRVAKQSGRNRVVRSSAISQSLPDESGTPRKAASIFHGVEARHVMTSPVVCLNAESLVGDAACFFVQSRINSVPITDCSGKLVGIISEKDVMQVMTADDAWSIPISDVMERNVVWYEERTPLEEVFDFLSRVSIRRVIIVDEGRPSGVISRGSLMRWFCNWTIVNKNEFATELSPFDRKYVEAAKSRLVEVSEGILDNAHRLLGQLSSDTDDVSTPLIDCVSNMQESMVDLLACSRYLNPMANRWSAQFTVDAVGSSS